VPKYQRFPLFFFILLLLGLLAWAALNQKDSPPPLSTQPTTNCGTLPPNDPARGIIYDGLVPGCPGDPCEGTFHLAGNPHACLHPDPGVGIQTGEPINK
jgi:hypothetical protein